MANKTKLRKPGVWSTNKYKLTPEQVQELKQERRNGETTTSLAKKYDISTATISNYLRGLIMAKEHQEKPVTKKGSWNTPKLTPEQAQELNHKHRNGQKMEALAKEYSVSKITVYKYLECSKQNRINHQENPPPKTKNLLDMFLFGAFYKPEA